MRVPSADGFEGQGTVWHVFRAIEEVARRVVGDASFEWIEAADLFQFLAENLTGPLEDEQVRFAVGQEFRLEIEDLCFIPAFEFSGFVSGHVLRIILFFLG